MSQLKYPVIFCDIDDTLLDNDRRLSASNEQAVSDFVHAGGLFILSTGRNFTGTKDIYYALGLSSPVVINQGSVYVPGEDRYLYHPQLCLSSLIRLCKFLEARNVYFQLFSDNDIFVQTYTAYSHRFEANCGVAITQTHIPLSAFAAQKDIPFDKLMIECSTAIIDDLLSEIKLTFPGCFCVEKSRSWIIEISSLSSTKGHAIGELLKAYNIPQSDAMAIGDSFSDISMFDQVGFSVAVKNSHPHVAARASAVTGCNHSSGVAAAIKAYAYSA